MVFSGDRKIPTQGSTIQVGNEAHQVSPWKGGPKGWDFLVPIEQQCLILFLTYHTILPFDEVLYFTFGNRGIYWL